VALLGDLAQVPGFVEAYGWALDSLHTSGARATLEVLLHGDMKG
jgi:mannitol 2-dehydrogenase